MQTVLVILSASLIMLALTAKMTSSRVDSVVQLLLLDMGWESVLSTSTMSLMDLVMKLILDQHAAKDGYDGRESESGDGRD